MVIFYVPRERAKQNILDHIAYYHPGSVICPAYWKSPGTVRKMMTKTKINKEHDLYREQLSCLWIYILKALEPAVLYFRPHPTAIWLLFPTKNMRIVPNSWSDTVSFNIFVERVHKPESPASDTIKYFGSLMIMPALQTLFQTRNTLGGVSDFLLFLLLFVLYCKYHPWVTTNVQQQRNCSYLKRRRYCRKRPSRQGRCRIRLKHEEAVEFSFANTS